MTGIDASTGRALGGIAHLRQSVRDILTTPVGTRVLLRDYGSRLHELVDRPLGPALLAAIQAEAAGALARWEPRLRLRRIRATAGEALEGRVTLALEGEYVPSGEPVRLEVAAP
ncbi:MAG: phage baseplate protein [Acidobacteria bacterium]|nr:phage baseplate protein [Acidobacteriota bacterium]MYF85708.1 phage baseplate protein [Rhodospirillaceae bacterium]MYI74946.1 phage baseplate protein [Acidobacteriota bacterium]